MTKTYGLYRYFYNERNNRYSPTFYLANQFADMAKAGIIGLEDNQVPENLYSGEIAPGIKTMRRFITGTFDETKLSETDFKGIVSNVSSMNDIVLFDTIEEARQWIRDNVTYISETTPGTFLLVEASDEGIDGPTEAVYLIIE